MSAVRHTTVATVAIILFALAWLGHMIALIAGALDALLAALLGLPRTRALGAIVAVMRDSWKDNR